MHNIVFWYPNPKTENMIDSKMGIALWKIEDVIWCNFLIITCTTFSKKSHSYLKIRHISLFEGFTLVFLREMIIITLTIIWDFHFIIRKCTNACFLFANKFGQTKRIIFMT